jgi:uncharacterized membrane protein YsdA (DUF1294 family)
VASRTRVRSPRGSSIQVRFIAIASILAVAIFVALIIWTNWNLLITWILAWSLVTFSFYGYDKLQAKGQRLRVPEVSLLVMAAAGGFAGAIGGMLLFRHKTTKLKFWVVNFFSLAAYAVLLVLSLW